MGFFLISLATAAFCLVAHRLATTIITAPVVFLSLGCVLSVSGLFPRDVAHALLDPVAETALVVLLFLDAAQTNLRALLRSHVWPVRMLLIGLPLAIGLGTLAGLALLPAWPLAALALAAAILAPTDAALGQAVVTNPVVPIRPRRALTVESGLNDGLALPAVLFFASLTAATTDPDGGAWLVFGLKQIVLGPLAGVAVGALGGWALLWAKAHRTTALTFEGIAALALAACAYLGAVEIGGNGFIAAFAAGLAFGAVVKGSCKFVYEFTESEGQLLAWSAFFLLGAALVPEAIAHLTWPMLAVIVVSLFIVRPLAIWLSLVGTDASGMTRLFFGWFGPRGLATALFALLIVEQLPDAYGKDILYLAINAVWISALLHGISAAPAARRYGQKVSDLAMLPEQQEIDASAKPIRETKQNRP